MRTTALQREARASRKSKGVRANQTRKSETNKKKQIRSGGRQARRRKPNIMIKGGETGRRANHRVTKYNREVRTNQNGRTEPTTRERAKELHRKHNSVEICRHIGWFLYPNRRSGGELYCGRSAETPKPPVTVI